MSGQRLDMPLVLIVEGPDGCGKTEVARALAKAFCVPYFRVSTQEENWRDGSFASSLPFDFLLPQFIKATRTSVVMDRGYPSEWAYSRVFERQTDAAALRKIDEGFEKIGAVTVILSRRDFSKNRADDLVPSSKLQELDRAYELFAAWTLCPVVRMHVDDYGNDIDRQTPVLVREIEKEFHGRRRPE